MPFFENTHLEKVFSCKPWPASKEPVFGVYDSERADFSQLLKGKSYQQVTCDQWEYNYDMICLMKPEAVVHFLPGMLLHVESLVSTDRYSLFVEAFCQFFLPEENIKPEYLELQQLIPLLSRKQYCLLRRFLIWLCNELAKKGFDYEFTSAQNSSALLRLWPAK